MSLFVVKIRQHFGFRAGDLNFRVQRAEKPPNPPSFGVLHVRWSYINLRKFRRTALYPSAGLAHDDFSDTQTHVRCANLRRIDRDKLYPGLRAVWPVGTERGAPTRSVQKI